MSSVYVRQEQLWVIEFIIFDILAYNTFNSIMSCRTKYTSTSFKMEFWQFFKLYSVVPDLEVGEVDSQGQFAVLAQLLKTLGTLPYILRLLKTAITKGSHAFHAELWFLFPLTATSEQRSGLFGHLGPRFFLLNDAIQLLFFGHGD